MAETSKLETFLRKERILVKFRARYCEHRVHNSKKTFNAFLNEHGNRYSSFGGSFIWSNTPEGVEYWGALREKWYVENFQEEEDD